jgi:hypothetical protein
MLIRVLLPCIGQPPLGELGQAIDLNARIERRQAVGGLISEYRRVA